MQINKKGVYEVNQELYNETKKQSKNSILIGDLAKLMKQQGIDTGQKRLFQWMRDNGYLIKNGDSKNMPTQKAMDMKLFEIKENIIINEGGVRTSLTTKVTGKGQIYFLEKLK